MPSDFAFVALFGTPVIAFILFRIYPPVLAAALTLVLGYLFLPSRVEVDLPVLPPFDRRFMTVCSVIVLAALAIAAAEQRKRRAERGLLVGGAGPMPKTLPGWLPASPVARVLMGVLILSALITSFFNSRPVLLGDGRFLPGYDLYSALSLAMLLGLNLLPFVIGRKLFAHPDGQKTLLTVIAGSAFAYSFLVLFEIRMSPQLHNWVYGFHPTAFGFAIRGDGFRPNVFLQHGLWLALFNCLAIIAAVGAFRSNAGPFKPAIWAMVALWLFLVLAISNSLGALMIAVVFLPVAFLLPSRAQLLIAACVGLLALTYPVMRERGIVPVNLMMSIATSIDADRGQSFNFRLENEDSFLAHTQERALTGWGRFDRNFIHDPETGERLSTVDGYWILTFSEGGYIRYIAEYGLLTLAFFQILRRRKLLDIGPETAALSLVLAANLIDMIPNATATVITWVVAGALVGRLEVLRFAEEGAGQGALGAIRGGRMRHRAASGIRPPKTAPGVVVAETVKEGHRQDAHAKLESSIPKERGDQYSRFQQVHSRKLRDDRASASAARQNFRRKTDAPPQ